MLADIMLVGHPIKMEHAYFTAGLGLSYSIFSLAYFLAGGLNRKNTTEIYPLLDWNKPGKTIVVSIYIFNAILFICLIFGSIHQNFD